MSDMRSWRSQGKRENKAEEAIALAKRQAEERQEALDSEIERLERESFKCEKLGEDPPFNSNLLYHAGSGDLIKLTALILLGSDGFFVGADIDTRAEDGKTPLIIAVCANIPEAVRLLLDFEADTSIKDDEGKTALDWAEQLQKETGGMDDIMEWLLNCGADHRKTIKTDNGETWEVC